MPRRHLAIAIAVVFLPLLVWAAVRRDEGGGRPIDPAPVRRSDGLPASVPQQAAQLLREGRNWRAARVLRRELGPDAPPEAVLVAARAEAGWGGWENVVDLLDGEDWLDRVEGGEGWYWLARAREEEGQWQRAADAYARYLRAPAEETAVDTTRAVAELRQGLVLLRAGKIEDGVRALEHARGHAGPIAGWVALLAAEALAERGDTARVRTLAERAEEGSALRAQRARVEAHREAGDARGARDLARAFRARAGSADARAALGLDAARAALAFGDSAGGRADLIGAMQAAPASSAAGEAAGLLARLPQLSAGERLLIAQVRDRRGANAQAAAGYAAWLGTPAGTADERRRTRLAMGRALFDAGEFARAEAALRPLATAPEAFAAQALYQTGRAQYRRGARSAAQATLLGLARRFPRNALAADALWLVADLSHDAGNLAQARALYRRLTVEHPGSSRTALARMRLAGLALLERRPAAAAAVLEGQRARGPGDPAWAQATYWAGRAYLAAGDRERARERFREVRREHPISYYALQAAEQLGEPYWPLALPAAPAEDPAVRSRVEEWMRGVDLLQAAGLRAEADAEAARLVERAGDDLAVGYALAEALNRRGLTVRGVRLGLQLQRRRGTYDERLLRILYPFPYRSMIAAESRERGLDPFLVAALTRQESTFSAGIASAVGARGLMQVMPETGRGLAAGAGIRDWDAELLFNPEINVHLGTRYLADQMRQWDGKLPYVFSAYNAGPNRVAQWRRFPEARDAELFTERIPYEETRDYVKILTRNIALYRGLYGEGAKQPS